MQDERDMLLGEMAQGVRLLLSDMGTSEGNKQSDDIGSAMTAFLDAHAAAEEARKVNAELEVMKAEYHKKGD